jgi:hypothetical protein
MVNTPNPLRRYRVPRSVTVVAGVGFFALAVYTTVAEPPWIAPERVPETQAATRPSLLLQVGRSYRLEGARSAGLMPTPYPRSSDPADWIREMQELRPGESFRVTATSYLGGGWYHVVVDSDGRSGWVSAGVDTRSAPAEDP